MDPTVTIVMPAFNEAETIGEVVRGLRERYPDWPVVVVDDGSRDSTAAQAESAGATVVRHAANRGYGAALKSGVRRAGGEIVVFCDADGQHDPADLGRLVEMMDGRDMVVGARPQGEGTTRARRPGKWILGATANLLVGEHIQDINSGLRAVRRPLLERFLHILPDKFSFSTTITLALLKDGFSVVFVPVRASPRAAGRSEVRFVRDGFGTLLLVLRTIMLFDPLKVLLPASLVIGAAALVSFCIDLTDFNLTDTTILLSLSALLVFFFGLVADQVAAIRREPR